MISKYVKGKVNELKRLGKWIIVMSAKGHISRELIERAKYINLKKLKDQIFLADKKSEKPEGFSEV